MNELSMKLDNAKKQLNDRIDREETERYTGIKELQDEISKLRNRVRSAFPRPRAGM